MVLCDLPYGTTACRWDSVIPFELLWRQYWRIVKPNAAIVLTAAQPFTTALVASQLKNFRYCWYWKKPGVTGFANAKRQPLRCIEDVCVFYRCFPIYNPQGLIHSPKIVRNGRSVGGESLRADIEATRGKGKLCTPGHEYVQEWTNYPRQVLEFKQSDKKVHPTQKPVALMEYLIRTYTNEGDTVLDNCMGSGTTGVACANSKRRFIGMEKDPSYFDSARTRIIESFN